MRKGKVAKPEYPRRSIDAGAPRDASPDDKGRAVAALGTSAQYHGMVAITSLSDPALQDVLDVPGLMESLQAQGDLAAAGDTGQAVRMLQTQATALQSIFSRLTQRAMQQTHMPNMDGLLRLALKAQAQCTRTLQVMNEILHPQAVIVARQANVASGHQQVNNGSVYAPDKPLSQSQLSGGHDELYPNARTPSPARRNDPAVEAMGEVNRPKNGRG